MLDQTPGLATYPLRVGASRQDPRPYFLIPIRHYVYTGDTALHVSALIDRGADPLLMNKSGSTPLHLAVQNTGKSNSGSGPAKEEQHRIIVLLLGHGASSTDLDAKGKTVEAAASSGWIRQLLDKY
jgi:ankyrin repeat protein